MQNNKIENGYFDGRKDWNDKNAMYKANASMWRIFGLANMFVTLVAVVGMIYAAQLPDVVPYLFKEDASGGITALGIPNTIMKVDNRMLANQMASFIIALRQVPIDTELRKNYVRRVKMMSTVQLFTNVLAPMLKEEYKNQGSIKVDINTVIPVNKTTWEIDWTEYTNTVPIGKYKSTLTYTRDLTIKDPTLMIFNPLGLIIKDVNINQVIGVGK